MTDHQPLSGEDSRKRYQTALDVSNELQDLEGELDSGAHAAPAAAFERIVDPRKTTRYRSRLVGREEELEELLHLLVQATSGRRAAVMIGGEVCDSAASRRRRWWRAPSGHPEAVEGAGDASVVKRWLVRSASLGGREVPASGGVPSAVSASSAARVAVVPAG